jgi:methylated-DNA-[protein]-cysteine S-methyltransferase
MAIALPEPSIETGRSRRAFVDTPLGTLVVEASERGLTYVALARSGDHGPDSEPAPGSILAEAMRQLEEYFAGTVSYGELATMAGHPGAARAAGNVMRGNQLMIVRPCHRVIGADGSLRGYGGLGAGLEHKRWLLELEGAIS